MSLKTVVPLALFVALLAPAIQCQNYRSVPGDATFLGRPSDVHLQVNANTFLADLNHDGNLDMVVYGYAATILSVLWGDGAGHFSQGPSIILNQGASGYARLVDMNGDGLPDFLYVGGPNVFRICYGNPDGSFQQDQRFKLSFPRSLNVGQLYSVNVLAADFNRDGKMDVAVAGQSGWEVLLNTGSGFQLSAQVLTAHGSPYTGFSTGDINGDGIPDLVFASLHGVYTYIGKGDGTFNAGTLVNLPNISGNHWEEVDLADWNGDGKLDLIVANGKFSASYLLAGNGDGTFGAATALQWPYLSGDYQVADFNNDGIPDLAGFGGAHVTVFPGLGGGQFGTPKSYGVDYYPGYGTATFSGLAYGSIRNNGKLDFAVPVTDGVSLLFNTGSGFEETLSTLQAAGASTMQAIDLNGDGLQDLVTVGPNGFQVFWGTGQAAQPFTPGPVSAASNLDGRYMALADFNGDGFLDVVATVSNLVVPNGGVAVFLGDGQGHFGAPINTAAPFAAWLAAADLNGDGKVDLVTSALAVQFGNGDGTFQAPITLSAYSISNILIGDFNGDGKPDIVTSISTPIGTPGIEVILNQGNGVFAAPVLTGENQQKYLAACDINSDGILDILPDNASPIPYVMLGHGDGTFSLQTRQAPTIQFEGSAFACGNFSGASKFPEIAMVSNYASSTLVSKYEGAGTFNFNYVGWGTGIGPLAIISGKFHGQSTLDDLVVLNGDGTISTLLNITKRAQ